MPDLAAVPRKLDIHFLNPASACTGPVFNAAATNAAKAMAIKCLVNFADAVNMIIST